MLLQRFCCIVSTLAVLVQLLNHLCIVVIIINILRLFSSPLFLPLSNIEQDSAIDWMLYTTSFYLTNKICHVFFFFKGISPPPPPPRVYKYIINRNKFQQCINTLYILVFC